MLTQKELVRLHPNHVIMNIDVLSFNRLAYRVFDELGIKILDVLEETGKSLAVRKLSMDNKDRLQVLQSNINKAGYISEIKSFISELSGYNINSRDFLDVINEGDFNSHFKKKAKDLQVIYEAYEEFIKDRYITAESLLVRLNEVIADSKMLSDAVFVFDGFTGFTPLQNELLKTILPLINRAYVVVTMDVREPLYGGIKDYELFAMSKKMIARTGDICETCNVDIEEEPIICNQNYRFKSTGYINYIERHLFRTGAPANNKTINNNADKFEPDKAEDSLSIHLLANPLQEIEYVATQIAKDVRECGIKYRDIAVCACNLSGYKDYFAPVFARYNIPFYLDCNTTVTYHPIIEFIKSAFLIYETNFAYEAVIQFLRCNLTDIGMDEVDMFDNYLTATRIRGVSSYGKDFTYQPKAFEDGLDVINDIRSRFVSPLITFYNSLQGDNGAVHISKALYQLMCDYDVESKLNLRANRLEEAGDNIKATEYSRIYKVIISILDKIVTLLQDDVITPDEYSKILLSACEEAKIATIPMSADCVVIGDMERTRYDKPKVMYMMGVNDGVIPTAGGGRGIISETERIALKELLSKRNADLAPTEREKSFMQRFYIYLILTKASDRLCITYAASDVDANALNRSYLIDEILSLFSDKTIDIIDNIKADDWLVTTASAKRYVASILRNYVYRSNKTSADTQDICELSLAAGLIEYAEANNSDCYNDIFNGAFYYHGNEEIDRVLYDELIDSDLPKGSVSKLETYRKCAYNYFLRYCLRLQEREKSSLQNIDFGSIYHDILEEFSNELSDAHIKWKDLDEEKRHDILEQSCDKVYGEYSRIELLDTPREIYIRDKIKTTLDKTIASLCEQAKHTLFEPYGFEVELNEIADAKDLSLALKDNRTMKLSGRIDRIDTYEEGGIVYVKIIDYKSGRNDIDYEKIYNGLQLQLIYYLDVAVKGMARKNSVKPAAMFYYRVQDPIVKLTQDSVEELVKKDMMPKGVFFDEVDDELLEAYKNSKDYRADIGYDIPKILRRDVAMALDTDCDKKSLYAPIVYTKDGCLSGQGTSALSVNDIGRIEKHIKKKMQELGSDMYAGVIDAKPVKDEGCKFCPYKGVCRFNIKEPGYQYSDYTDFNGNKKEELFNLIGDGDA